MQVDHIIRSFSDSSLELAKRIERLSSANPWIINDFKEALSDDTTIVLEAILPCDNGREEYVGHVVASAERGVFWFHIISVHPEWQRCGIGSSLYQTARMAMTETLGVKAGRVYAQFSHKSKPHAAFWRSMGFRDIHANAGGMLTLTKAER